MITEGDEMKSILVVDDEDTVRSSLALLLKGQFDVNVAPDGLEALEMIEQSEPDLILLDVMMPKLDGIETLKKLRNDKPHLPVIMLTASNTVKTAVEAMKLGAKDYLSKPFDVEELTGRIVDTLDENPETVIPQQAALKRDVAKSPAKNVQIIGSSTAMEELLEQVDQVAKRESTVLITGESGVGKELIARRIHTKSERVAGPFVAINCAAIPESLIESELFGHERGAFTSAVEQRIGHFELADGGTLFLDEIGELSLAVQVKMLRFLQEQEFIRVGSSEVKRVDVRVIAATNKNLETLVKEKKFRQDLFYRVHVVNLQIPPLRERYEDIPSLIEYFVESFGPAYGNRKLTFTEDAMTQLREYTWPGNVRELENVIESLLALAPADEIPLEVLPARIRVGEPKQPTEFISLDKNLTFEEAERQFESDIILKALKRTNYVQTRAAELLGISRRILKYKMDKLGITDKLRGDSEENSDSETSTPDVTPESPIEGAVEEQVSE